MLHKQGLHVRNSVVFIIAELDRDGDRLAIAVCIAFTTEEFTAPVLTVTMILVRRSSSAGKPLRHSQYSSTYSEEIRLSKRAEQKRPSKQAPPQSQGPPRQHGQSKASWQT